MKTLRYYQNDCQEKVIKSWERYSSVLAVMPTGTGKTTCFCSIAKDKTHKEGGRSFTLTHRRELVEQSAATMQDVTGDTVAIEMSKYRSPENSPFRARHIIATVQTLDSADPSQGKMESNLWHRRLEKFNPDEFNLLILDEAHHGTARTWKRVIRHFKKNPNLRILLVTATPDRADEEAMGQIVDHVAYEYSIEQAIKDGFLVPIEQRFVVVEDIDFSKAKAKGGDFSDSDVEEIMDQEKILQGVIRPTMEIAGDRSTLIFAAGVGHAERMAEIINRAKPGAAACVHGKTPKEKRKQIMDDFRGGKVQYLTNCGVVTEGVDVPIVSVVAMARPTLSRSLYAQMLGRGTRVLPGTVDHDWMNANDRKEAIWESAKREVLVLDYVGNSGKHKLVHAPDILGGKYSEEILDEANGVILRESAKGQPMEIMAAVQEARRVIEARAADKRREIMADVQYSSKLISPFEMIDIKFSKEPGWFRGKLPTEPMLEMLRKHGVDTKGLSFSKAKDIITHIIDRQKKGLWTLKQERLLNKHGFFAEMTFGQASRKIEEIKQNCWGKLHEVIANGSSK